MRCIAELTVELENQIYEVHLEVTIIRNAQEKEPLAIIIFLLKFGHFSGSGGGGGWGMPDSKNIVELLYFSLENYKEEGRGVT